jgi:transposase
LSQTSSSSRQTSERICHTNADLQDLYQLGQDFVQMVKRRQARRLDGWLTRASQSSSVELRGFASGIKRDYAAVKAALSLPWIEAAGRRADYASQIPEKADVWAGSL